MNPPVASTAEAGARCAGSTATRQGAGHTAGMDPTGMSSPLGQLVIAAGLIATIVVLIMVLRRRR